jgi:hypothetical protein
LRRISAPHYLLYAEIGIVNFRKPGLSADDRDSSEQISAFQPFLALFFLIPGISTAHIDSFVARCP